MAMQYKPTKQKKEKPVKAPKAPKAEKPVKMGAAMKVKTSKPAKTPKPPKAPKAEKAVAFTPAFKGGKVEKAANLEQGNVLKKPVNPKIVIPIVAALVVIVVLIFTVVLPAVERNGQMIDQIMISSTPDQTTYFIGQEANYDGLRVQVTRKNGETFNVRANQCQMSGFDSSKKGNCEITVNYEGFETSFFVSVEEPPKITPALAGISIETMPNKLVYKLGEWLDTTGGVILCEYVDGSVMRINLTNQDVYGFPDIKTPGEYELTVKYVEKGIVCKTSYTITVTG